MTTVTVSPKFQIVIPRAIRDKMNIKVGQKVQLIEYGDRVEIIPLKKVQDLKGFLKGMDTKIDRERDRL